MGQFINTDGLALSHSNRKEHMKHIIILVLLMAAQCHAGWFDHDDQRIQQYEQQLTAERHKSGGLGIAVIVLAIGGVVLFTVGTALGSKTKRDGKQ
jgi:hypothetical protein